MFLLGFLGASAQHDLQPWTVGWLKATVQPCADSQELVLLNVGPRLVTLVLSGID